MANTSSCASAPVEFQFQSNVVRTVAVDGEVWFCASDVCDVLGYVNSRKTIQDHCKISGVTKRDISSGGQMREVVFINEPNLYRLVIRSKKPEAEKFEMWVMEEVLPAIRKTGKYEKADQLQIDSSQLTIEKLIKMLSGRRVMLHFSPWGIGKMEVIPEKGFFTTHEQIPDMIKKFPDFMFSEEDVLQIAKACVERLETERNSRKKSRMQSKQKDLTLVS